MIDGHLPCHGLIQYQNRYFLVFFRNKEQRLATRLKLNRYCHVYKSMNSTFIALFESSPSMSSLQCCPRIDALTRDGLIHMHIYRD
jgi:hypothetical protein